MAVAVIPAGALIGYTLLTRTGEAFKVEHAFVSIARQADARDAGGGRADGGVPRNGKD